MICSFLMASLTTSSVDTKSDAPHPAWSSNILLRSLLFGPRRVQVQMQMQMRELADQKRKLAVVRVTRRESGTRTPRSNMPLTERSTILAFKAGRAFRRDGTNIVEPSPDKGAVVIERGEDEELHFMWKNRDTEATEEVRSSLVRFSPS
jgi:hypothetical protein